MWAVVKKEFKSYFLSPIGYVIVGILLFVSSVFFYLTSINPQIRSVDLGALYFYDALYGLIIVVPILTMRMFSEERKNGTEQLLLTTPISITRVVFGKLFAALGVICISLIASLMYFIIVQTFAKASIIPVLTSMFGFILISAAAISVGMFASTLTENQIISGIITIAFLLMSVFLPNISEIFSKLSLISYFNKFPTGRISLTEIAGLLSFAMVFIGLTIIVMQRRKSVK